MRDPERLFASLIGSRALVLAVSGGADSTALMVLAARWPGRPSMLVVTVDHGLRPESADEAALVVQNAAKLGLPSRAMRAPQWPGRGNLQDWARRARYACLLEAARAAGADSIAVAHHLEDQAETFLLRMARGSGVYGLAAMAEATDLEGVRLVRPLLHLSRAELAQVAAESGLLLVHDPSNTDRRFDRVRMRDMAPALQANGLSSARLAETAGRLGRAAAALDFYAHALLQASFRAGGNGVVSGPAKALSDAPEEVGLRALALLLAAVGGAEYGPRLDRLEAFWRAVVDATPEAAWKRTLHGVVVRLAEGRITAHREWGRNGVAAIPASAGATMLWDRRFQVRIPELSGDLRLGPLGGSPNVIGLLRRGGGVASAAARTLPSLYRADRLIAVPPAVIASAPEQGLAVMPTECLVGRRLRLNSCELPPQRAGIDHERRGELLDRPPQFTLASTLQQPI